MKAFFTLLLTLVFYSLCFSQIEWASQGTKWWYYFKFDLGSPVVTEYESVGQTTIAGKTCQTITSADPWDTTTIFTYEENGKVYIANAIDSVFYLRYDFYAQAGDSWELTGGFLGNDTFAYFVDTLRWMEFNGQQFQVQETHSTLSSLPEFITAHEWVILSVGSISGFGLPVPSELTPTGFGGLGCYQSPETGLLSFGNVLDCQALSTPTQEEAGILIQLELRPNPSPGESTLEYTLPAGAKGEVRIFDSLGRQLAMHPVAGENGRLALTGYPPGVYFVALVLQGKIVQTGRFILF